MMVYKVLHKVGTTDILVHFLNFKSVIYNSPSISAP